MPQKCWFFISVLYFTGHCVINLKKYLSACAGKKTMSDWTLRKGTERWCNSVASAMVNADISTIAVVCVICIAESFVVMRACRLPDRHHRLAGVSFSRHRRRNATIRRALTLVWRRTLSAAGQAGWTIIYCQRYCCPSSNGGNGLVRYR